MKHASVAEPLHTLKNSRERASRPLPTYYVKVPGRTGRFSEPGQLRRVLG